MMDMPGRQPLPQPRMVAMFEIRRSVMREGGRTAFATHPPTSVELLLVEQFLERHDLLSTVLLSHESGGLASLGKAAA